MKRTNVGWALMAAIGASYLVVGLALALRELVLPFVREIELALTNRMLYLGGLAEPVLLSLSLALGAATGTFVARRAGAVTAAALYAALVLLAAISFVVAAALREQQLRGSDCCVVVTVFDYAVAAAVASIPPIIGLFLGSAIARVPAPAAGPNAVLEAAGGYATVGAVAVILLGPRLPMLVAPSTVTFAAYGTVTLEPLPHAVALTLQVILSAAVYVLRGGAFDLPAIRAFALMGVAGVAYFDLLEIWFTLTLDHQYIPASLFVVPLVSAGLGAVVLLALNGARVKTT